MSIFGEDFYSKLTEYYDLAIARTGESYFADVNGITYDKIRDINIFDGYYYANTVYDDEGILIDRSVTDKELYDMTDEYISSLAYPLPKRKYGLYDLWYNNRSEGNRRHMGTDIYAKTGEDILSICTGTVKYLGFEEKSGYTVMITDSTLGYTYNYMHLREQPDFLQVGQTVTAGELIGRAGQSGSAKAAHLHLGITSRDGKYVNPYPVLYQVLKVKK